MTTDKGPSLNRSTHDTRDMLVQRGWTRMWIRRLGWEANARLRRGSGWLGKSVVYVTWAYRPTLRQYRASATATDALARTHVGTGSTCTSRT
jgi:hypothetical protein